MKEVIFLVSIFSVDVFPFVSEALGRPFLMFQENIEVRNGVDGALPLDCNISRKLIFPGSEKILMGLEEICFEFIDEDAGDSFDDGIPRIVRCEESGTDMTPQCFENLVIEFFRSDRVREVFYELLSHKNDMIRGDQNN
jgi:hypothetical protein